MVVLSADFTGSKNIQIDSLGFSITCFGGVGFQTFSVAAKQKNHNQSFTCGARNIVPLVPREKKTFSKTSYRSQEFWGKFYICRQTKT